LLSSENLRPYLAGFVASITGSIATFGIALAGLAAMGASQAQSATAIAVGLVGYGVMSIALSFSLKMPVSVVWSTPGAAFLAASALLGVQFDEAVAAFLFSAVLLTLTGLWPALGRLVAKIPAAISSAMLAGVIFPFVVSVVLAAVGYPALMLPVVVLWFVLNRFLKVWASAIAVSVGFVAIALSPELERLPTLPFWPELGLVTPNFDFAVVLAIGLPLYLITMASQNLPGIAIMNALGYRLPTQKVLTATGLASLVTAPFGVFGLNLAAITAALNADEGAGADSTQRWKASVTGGLVYILSAVVATPFAAFVLAVPTELFLALAGLALLPTFAGSVSAAVTEPETRLAATATFLIGAAGITVFAIGGAFWALVTGVFIWLLGPRPNRVAS
jgi:benzoate membrane transport protein